jgi:hypothetical protein
MDIDYITISSGSHYEKMDLKATYPNFHNAQMALNMILKNCLKIFDHGLTSIDIHFADGYVGGILFRTSEGMNGHYFIADLLDELVEYLENRIKGRYFGLEDVYKRLKVIQEEWVQHYDHLYEIFCEQTNDLGDISFLMQMNSIKKE